MNDTNALLPFVALRFNVDHPSYEECYLFGYECAEAEVSEEENPFEAGSTEAEQWQEGWWAAAYGEKPLFDLDAIEEERQSMTEASNDQQFCRKHNFISLVLEIGGALAASALVGYQIFELVA